MRSSVIQMLLVGLSLILSACASTTDQNGTAIGGQVVPVDGGGSYVDITVQDLDRMLDTKDFFFVNVHIPYEGEIPNTDAFIAFDEIQMHLAEFPGEVDAKIVLYCRSGSMSAIAARDLVNAGYTNVFNLDGGFRAWAQAGYEFIQ
jgi:rhodanese-related sulfurtransferase